MLSVPYVSQIMPGALIHNNDCGAASALMVLRAYNLGKDLAVDQVYDLISPTGDVPLSAGGLQTLLANRLVKNTWMAGVHIHDMYDILAARRPIIALIHYAPLVKAGLTEKTGFLGAHFVVVIGMDITSICIHDPYSTGLGESIEVPIAVFEQAWAECPLDGNPDHAGIFMTLSIQDLTTPIPQPGEIKFTFGVNNGVLINGINVRGGPGSNYAFIKTLWRTATPFVYIIKISGEWGQLADGSGWVYLPYLARVA
jgi:hypothetical protein